MKEIINVAKDAVKEAGELLLERFGNIKEIEKKSDRNFATDVDKAAEKIIIDKIKTVFPKHGILAEESGKHITDNDYLWVIDPLDGTHNYMRNIEVFGVSIGILYKGAFVAGAIYMPVSDELYLAEEKNGAYKNGERISVSTVKTLDMCTLSFDSSIRHGRTVMLNTLGDLADKVFNVRMTGSSVRLLTYLAEGKFDAAVEFHDRPWDFAGAVTLIKEAGGRMVTLKGSPVTIDTIGYVAANEFLTESILDIVKTNITKKNI
ncbi:MAG: inositol monophosphatase [Candidatus Omnitrophica bacterium]|nr:inositol monophosphatase [Candidatus Omnitrophota bacterium]MDD5081251.1 inositol monophosphatase [Candidatus Omnitrophota bacterium]MDD5441557.1 inositol monophosphatase [Candidatus Omnitrophota bacterium]